MSMTVCVLTLKLTLLVVERDDHVETGRPG
jgi:hypothetical protein